MATFLGATAGDFGAGAAHSGLRRDVPGAPEQSGGVRGGKAAGARHAGGMSEGEAGETFRPYSGVAAHHQGPVECLEAFLPLRPVPGV